MKKLNTDMAYSQGEMVPVDSPKMQAPDTPVSDDAPTLLDNPLEITLTYPLCNLTCVLASREAVNKAQGCDPRVFFQDVSFLVRMSQHTSFAALPQALNWCPAEAENRGSDIGGGAQVLHDINLAHANLIADYPSIPNNLKVRALQRATSRSWKWARRRGGKSVFSKYFMRNVLAYILPHAGNTAMRIQATCDAFHEPEPVRVIPVS
ncbi:MAG: hypothetical protein HON65_05570 [Rhodospirillales bacterium]|nr:hypothetical protein [Rhodospirillales bacterium]